jgi:SAM-dependent methyltransferase
VIEEGSIDAKATRTIQDFGEQWTAYPDNSGYYGSSALFADVWGPLLAEITVRGRRIAEIAAGRGRYVNVLLDAGAEHVVAIEPSDAMQVVKANTAARADRITYLNVTGDRIPQDASLDYVFSIGVLHHIPAPLPVLVAARGALKPGGRFCAWLYGAEGNALYLAAVNTLRAIATRVPNRLVVGMVWLLYWPLRAYIAAARRLPLPLRGYMTEVLGRLDHDKIRVVIYDQLRPSYARYYTREQVEHLFAAAGYTDIRLHHRHGYSWSVCASNPGDPGVHTSSNGS